MLGSLSNKQDLGKSCPACDTGKAVCCSKDATLLHAADCINDLLEVQKLLAAGCDCRAASCKAVTPLHLAFHESYDRRPDYPGDDSELVSEPLVAALLAHGARISAKDNIGRTPLHMLADMSQAPASSAVIQLMLKHCTTNDVNAQDRKVATKREDMTDWAAPPDPSLVQALVAAGADMSIQDVKGHSPLHKAAKNEFPCNIDDLVKLGANAALQDSQGKTPIHLIIEEYRCTCSGGLSFLVHSNNGKSAMQTKDKAVRDSGALTNRLRPGDKADCLCQFGNYFTCS